jgi:(+)-trans-carveol dehydrogenase
VPGRVQDKIALISGGARGLGRSHAVRLAAEGADIVLFDSLGSYPWRATPPATSEDLAETVRLVRQSGRRVLARRADVTRRDQVQAVVDEAVTEFGRIDIVVANAGVCSPGGPFWKIPARQWEDTLAVNLGGVWNLCSAVAAPMMSARSGSIVVTASGAGLMGTPNVAEYNASKWAVVGLAKTMANELAASGIRVNCICPGTVGTDMVLNDGAYRLFRPDLANPAAQDMVGVLSSLNPMGRPWLEPSDVSNLVLFLASDEARYMTGTVIPVDLGNSNMTPLPPPMTGDTTA